MYQNVCVHNCHIKKGNKSVMRQFSVNSISLCQRHIFSFSPPPNIVCFAISNLRLLRPQHLHNVELVSCFETEEEVRYWKVSFSKNLNYFCRPLYSCGFLTQHVSVVHNEHLFFTMAKMGRCHRKCSQQETYSLIGLSVVPSILCP